MSLFDISIDMFLFLMMAFCFGAGFLLRGRQLQKKKKRIAELEKEMLDIHAEILEVQKEYCELEARIKDMAIPVISIRQAAVVKEDVKEKEKKPGDGGVSKKRSDRSA